MRGLWVILLLSSATCQCCFAWTSRKEIRGERSDENFDVLERSLAVRGLRKLDRPGSNRVALKGQKTSFCKAQLVRTNL